MKLILKSVIIAILLISTNLSGQKTSPVAGDAAFLIDLLRKDYNTIDPQVKEEQINIDRRKVLSTFRKYLGSVSSINPSNSTNVISNSLREDQELLKTKQNEYNNVVQENARNNTFPNTQVYTALTREIKRLKRNIRNSEFGLYQKEVDFLENNFSNNAYLNYVLKKFIEKYEALHRLNLDKYGQHNHIATVQKSVPFLGGDMAFEIFIDGLSKFLAERIKAELADYALSEIKSKLTVQENNITSIFNELNILLPETKAYILTFETDGILNFIDDLKQYIEKDLANLVTNLPNLKDSPRIKDLLSTNSDWMFAFEALSLIPKLSKAKHPINYFEMLSNSPALYGWSKDTDLIKHNIANTVLLSSMLGNSLTIIEKGEQKFVTAEFISNYGSEPTFIALFLGFLHQQNLKYFHITFINSTNTKINLDLTTLIDYSSISKLEESLNNLESTLKRVYGIVENAERLYQNLLEIKKASLNDDNNTKPEVIHQFANDLIGILENAFIGSQAIIEVYDSKESVVSKKMNFIPNEKVKKFIDLAKIGNNIVLDLQKKRYSSALLSAAKVPLLAKGETIDDKSVIKIINFVNEIALAENSEQVASAVDNFALPRGSYKLKKESDFNVFINAYPGLLGGVEFSKFNSSKGIGTIGITAPIGISSNLGFMGDCSIYLTIIDIAAPVRLRLDSEKNTKALSDYNFKNILAPGLYFTFPLGKKNPFAINIGAQYGPELDFEENAEGAIENSFTESFRIGLGLVIDIPLLTIYNKPENTN